MRKVWLVACGLLFISAGGFARTPSRVPLTNEALATILGQPAVADSCAPQAQQGGMLFDTKNPSVNPATGCNGDHCCNCAQTGNCFDCCLCDGGSFNACIHECFG
jgi:hypothetical protein